MDDRHVGTRTPDLYRVKSEVKLLQPFSCLAFPFSQPRKTALKPPIFGDELVTSFVRINLSDPYFLRKGFWHTALANDWREFRPSQGILSRKETISAHLRAVRRLVKAAGPKASYSSRGAPNFGSGHDNWVVGSH